MSRYGAKWFNPAQVFAQFTTTSEKDDEDKQAQNQNSRRRQQPDGDQVLAGANRRDIQVSESAELSLPPDRARLSITCISLKESVDEVKQSVNRRVDYIIQTLKSYRIKDTSYKVNRILFRTDKNYNYEVEVQVEFSDFLKCEEISNLLVEKLDESVMVSSPVFYHSPLKLETLRTQACVGAVKNAKNKALQVVQMFNQVLGPPITIREEHFEEFVGAPPEHATPSRDQQRQIQSYQEKIAMATVTVNVKVFVAFEIREKATRVHKRKK